jgi:2',3'-cyclic-nucleotide 2'-phosphodiesterase/3'-nucleotidase
MNSRLRPPAVFPQGDVKIKDLAGLYIYDNTLEAVVLTGAEVRAYLEYSAKYFVTPAPGAPADPATISDPAVPDYNYDVLSGVDYDIDISRPVGSRITRLQIAGADVDPAARFVVAVNNYRRSRGGNFPGIVKTQVYNAQQEIRQLLIEWAQAEGAIDPADFFVKNWQLVRDGVPVEF